MSKARYRKNREIHLKLLSLSAGAPIHHRSWKANVAHTKQTFTDKNILLKIEASHPTHDMNSAKLSRKLSLPPFLQFAFLFSVGGNR